MDGGPSLNACAQEPAAIVGLAYGVDRPVDVEHSLEELQTATAGTTVGLRVLQERRHTEPASLLGRGPLGPAPCDRAS
jgi:hypothetical protein